MRISIYYYQNDAEAESYLRPMRAGLTERGHTVKDSLADGSLDRSAPSQIPDADAVIFLISEHALRLDALTHDAHRIIALADARGHPAIVPHLVGGIHFEDVPPPLNRHRLLRAQSPEYIFPQLTKTLEHIARVQAAEAKESLRLEDTARPDAPGAQGWDLFLSHAREDNTLATQLYDALRRRGFHVFFDEASLRLGDSLTRKIDEAIARCGYGVVLLSPSFLATHKRWTRKELKSLLARQTRTGQKCILPVWHGVTEGDVASFSEDLADMMAVRTEAGLEAVVEAIAKATNAAAEADETVRSRERSPERTARGLAERHALRSFTLETELNESLIHAA